MLIYDNLFIMVHLVFKNELDKSKIDVLMSLLKSWNVDAQFENINAKSSSKKSEFSLSAGIWKDYPVDGKELRTNAWQRK